jgi:hypothetical protein
VNFALHHVGAALVLWASIFAAGRLSHSSVGGLSQSAAVWLGHPAVGLLSCFGCAVLLDFLVALVELLLMQVCL